MSTQKILIQLPTSQHTALKSMADRVGISVAAQARIAFQYYIEHHMPKEPMVKQSPNSTTELEQRFIEMVNAKATFASNDDAHHWMTSFMQLRTTLAQRLNRPKESFTLPMWAAEQVHRDPDTGMYSLPKFNARAAATEESQLEQERVAFDEGKPVVSAAELAAWNKH